MQVRRREGWREIAWRTLGEQIRNAAGGLYAMGLRGGDRLAILAENCPEWAVVDLACLFHGAVDVPLYTTSTADEIAYILSDSGAKAVAVAGEAQAAKVLGVSGRLPQLEFLVFMDDGPAETARIGRLHSVGLKGLMAMGQRTGGGLHAVAEPGLATLIYTSGTTGPPKGVMLSHANILANCRGARDTLPLGEDDVFVSFLPLSHSFERTAGLYTLLMTGSCVAYGGGTLTLARDLLEVRPTVLCCVPRVLEMLHRRLQAEWERARFPKKTVLGWALNVGRAVGRYRPERRRLPLLLSVQERLADRILFRRLRDQLGGRIRFLISGGAPLAPAIARFFHGAGLPVYEGYGLTEAAPVVSCNLPDHCRVGSVGRPLPGVEVRTDEDGEILVRGPNVMLGYHNREEETRASIDEQGWLHTGDVGTIDDDGFIYITDRKKDLIVTSQGENVAPQNIETTLKEDPLIEEACVIGDRRPYLTALIVPNLALVETLARSRGLPPGAADALAHPQIRAIFRRRVDQANKALPQHARLRTFSLLSQSFSQERGELTPTMKIKRQVVQERYRNVIEGMYRSGGRRRETRGDKKGR